MYILKTNVGRRKNINCMLHRFCLGCVVLSLMLSRMCGSVTHVLELNLLGYLDVGTEKTVVYVQSQKILQTCEVSQPTSSHDRRFM
jgi:hypothetical protein